MAHHGDYRGPWQLHHVLVIAFVHEICIRIVELGGERQMTHFLDHDHRGFLVEYLIDRDHRTHFHQRLDDFRGLDRHFVRKIGHRNGFRHMHFAHDRFNRLLHLHFLRVPMTAAMATATLRTTPPGCTGITAGLDRAPLRGVILPCVLLGRLRLAVVGFRGRLVDSSGHTRGSGLLCLLGFCSSQLSLLLRKAGFGLSTRPGFAVMLFPELGGLNCGQFALALHFCFAQRTLSIINHRFRCHLRLCGGIIGRRSLGDSNRRRDRRLDRRHRRD